GDVERMNARRCSSREIARRPIAPLCRFVAARIAKADADYVLRVTEQVTFSRCKCAVAEVNVDGENADGTVRVPNDGTAARQNLPIAACMRVAVDVDERRGGHVHIAGINGAHRRRRRLDDEGRARRSVRGQSESEEREKRKDYELHWRLARATKMPASTSVKTDDRAKTFNLGFWWS